MIYAISRVEETKGEDMECRNEDDDDWNWVSYEKQSCEQFE